MSKRIVLLGLLIGLFLGCQKDDKREKEISKIPVSFQIERFDQRFAQSTPADLPVLKKEYPFLFPKHYPDSIWVNQMNDTLQQKLDKEVEKKYPKLPKIKAQLTGLFQHLKYYYPKFKIPRVITTTSYVDYLHRVVGGDSLLIISLDTYLGTDHKFYDGIQDYLRKNMKESQIAPDVARHYGQIIVPAPEKRTFLSYMVFYGKLRYFMQRLLPTDSEAAIMGYSKEELTWAQENEKQIWGYFIQQNILYQTKPDLRRDFFDLGPFTRFGLTLDSKSPPQLGQYLGLQIVKQFAEKNPKMKLSQILQMDNKTLFEKSNYKPKQQ